MADFTIRIFKAWRSDAIERAWSNTYEIISGDAGPTDLAGVANDIVEAERKLELTDVHFLQWTISTWGPDSKPYNPDTFITRGLTVKGSRGNDNGINDTALDYNVCLQVKRNAATGRTGRLFFRGVLMEGDVMMGGDGRFVLVQSQLGPIGQAFTDYATGLAAYLGNESGETLGLVSKSGTTIHRRPILSMQLGGVVVNKHNHRYFDRA